MMFIDSNHIDDVPNIRLYEDHDLASPDSDQLQLPVAPDASKHTGLSDYFTTNSFLCITKHS